MGEMARHIKEKEMAVAEEDRLRKHSVKQQAMLQEMRRKLASKAHYQGKLFPSIIKLTNLQTWKFTTNLTRPDPSATRLRATTDPFLPES